MPARLHPSLVNDPFGDPGVYVEFMFERRALLFDLGDLTGLSGRKLLKTTDVFVSHMHMDHFSGFDQMLRRFLGRGRTLRIYGPPGLICAVGHKLAAYTWNLVSGYTEQLVIEVSELHRDQQTRTVSFPCRSGFRAEPEKVSKAPGGVLLKESTLSVRATALDHGVTCLAFALEETARVNIWKNRLAALGLAVGPWLRQLKIAVEEGAPDDLPIPVVWCDPHSGEPPALPLGCLKHQILTVTKGQKIAYVVDTAFTEDNARNIIDLARDADVLFIETPFLDIDRDRATERRHLTARQAGMLAREAGAKRIVTLHYSPRYADCREALKNEAEVAFKAHSSREHSQKGR